MRAIHTIALALLLLAAPAWAAELVGYATVVDGDTIRLGAARVRLAGIDAPETRQTCLDAAARRWPCGVASTAALRAMLAGDPVVTCKTSGTDRYGRSIATCRNRSGDLAAHIVEAGWAIAYRRYSAAYVEQERSARSARLGIWAGAVERPEQWRREHHRFPLDKPVSRDVGESATVGNCDRDQSRGESAWLSSPMPIKAA